MPTPGLADGTAASDSPRTLHFLHIGKTGGTAIIHALSPYRNGARWKMIFHPHKVTLEQITAGEAVFFALRDPVDRFISGFNSRRRQGMPRYTAKWNEGEAIAFAAFATPNDLARALSAASEQVKGQAEAAMNVIGHVRFPYGSWLKSVDYLASRKSDILWVGRTEKLTADFENLKRLLEVPADCVLPSDPVLAHRRLETDETQLDALGTANIKKWYAPDYEILRYFA